MSSEAEPWKKSPRYPNPLADAESRRRNTANELDGCPILKRPSQRSTFSEDLSDPCAILDDKVLEPCPHISTCSSFSEVLNSSARPRAKTASHACFVDTPPVKPTRALTTVFSNCPPHSPAPIATHSAKLSALQLEAEYESFNLNQGTGPEPPTSPAAGLPTEVMHQIFYSLHPTDFNAARAYLSSMACHQSRTVNTGDYVETRWLVFRYITKCEIECAGYLARTEYCK